MGPSMKEKRGPPTLRETRFAKACVSAQKRRTFSSSAGKSTLLGTGLYTRSSGTARGRPPEHAAEARARDATGGGRAGAASGALKVRPLAKTLRDAARAER